MVAQVTESGAETLSFMQGVLINTEILGTLQGEPLISLAACELRVDPAHRGRPEALVASDGARTHTVVMMLEHFLPKGFRAVPAFDDTGELGQEAAVAASALKAPRMDVQEARSPERLKVPSLAYVAALAADARAKAVGAALGFKR